MGCCCCREFEDGASVEECKEASYRSDSEQISELLQATEEIMGGLTAWQRSFCSLQVLRIFLRGRKGDTFAAAEILAKSLIWREQYKEVLSGAKCPKWQGDFRVLAQSEDGHPLLYLCCRHQHCAFNVTDTLEHVAVVLETAVKSMPSSVQQMDVVVDCHCFKLRYNLDPRMLVGIAELLRQPYRDRLRLVMMVDAPMMIQPAWRIVYPLLPPATQRKFRFLNADEAVCIVEELQGSNSALSLQQVIQDNRGHRTPPKPCMPSEVADGISFGGTKTLNETKIAQVDNVQSRWSLCQCRRRAQLSQK